MATSAATYLTDPSIAIDLPGVASDPFDDSWMIKGLLALDIHDHRPGFGKQIPTAGIEDDAVTIAKMANSSVGADQIVALAVGTAHIAALAVTGAKIADNSIEARHISGGAISHAMLGLTIIMDENIAADAAIAQSKISNATRAIDAHAVDGAHAGNAAGNVCLLDGNARVPDANTPSLAKPWICIIQGEAGGADGGYGSSPGIVWKTAYARWLSVYFEAHLQCDEGYTNTTRLRSTSTVYATITRTGDNYVRVRSSALAQLPPDGTFIYFETTSNSGWAAHTSDVRLIIE
jgi:hypothetical protein